MTTQAPPTIAQATLRTLKELGVSVDDSGQFIIQPPVSDRVAELSGDEDIYRAPAPEKVIVRRTRFHLVDALPVTPLPSEDD